MKKELFVALLILSVLLVIGCTPKAGQINQTGVYVSFFNETEDEEEPTLVVVDDETSIEEEMTSIPEETPVKPETTVKPAEVPEGIPVKTYKEGDLVELKVSAIDPDNDKLTITYSNPLDEEGRWQTKVGDAGQYKIKIKVSDNKSTISKDMLIVIEPKNNPPVIEIDKEINVKEGNTVKIEPVITDPDGDDVTVKYTGWMTTPEYATNYNDAGSYIVTIIASDEVSSVAKDVKVNVINVNRPPVITGLEPISVVEGELATIVPTVTDPDGDDITLSFSAPFNDKGEWQTKEGDAGDSDVTVTATDGTAVVNKEVKVMVAPLNRPPVIQRIKDIEVKEGETVTISPVIIDPDGDQFSVAFSGWMDSPTYTTTYDDAGIHVVTITAVDTKGASNSQDVKITVEDVNRPPEITIE